MSVYLLGTLDTKGHEAAFVRDALRDLGIDVRVVNTGCLGEPLVEAAVSADDVFAAAGTSLADLRKRNDRGEAVTCAARGAAELVRRAHAAGEVDGVLGLGGSAGTTIATAAMRALPLGVPKVMVSTMASGQVRHWVGDKDVFMLNAVVDISGINRISRLVLGQAAAAMAGLVRYAEAASGAGPPGGASRDERPLIAATMFGVTTQCVERARRVLEDAGYEVLVFHATGNGGQAMESLIADGLIAGVLDITTTELADELVGGILSAGPDRLTAAGRRGVPQVISVGATDMVNFGPPETVPERFAGRRFYRHNPTVTLMRTTVEENRALGAEIGRKAAAAKGPTSILLPLRGVSAIDCGGKPFDDPAARAALFDAVRAHHGGVELIELNRHINDAEFAEAAASRLLQLIAACAQTPQR
ncbi:MAG TPA: Tm-1-like ATP-binding domain-containing protein [Planctomycetaceae bacterium]|nr:Tm-1-like ATP-binding domain-containing protein [Planctomycetaceae bacterium]